MLQRIYILLCTIFISACNSDSATSTHLAKSTEINEQIINGNLPIPDNRFQTHYNILIFGNSHANSIGPLIEKMIKAENSNIKVDSLTVGGSFLDSQDVMGQRAKLLQEQSWSHIVLQGQKYSQSGAVEYPTRAAKMWISQAKANAIMPILFPEHPQRGNLGEASRVHNIHKGIVLEQKACVAPIGLAWDRVISLQPDLYLYLSDGNHASTVGKALTAFVLYEVITGNPADLLPFIEDIDVDMSTQQLFRQIASETIQSHLPCDF